jgi:hypothetical protein
MTNRDFSHWQRANVAGATNYSEVTLDRIASLENDYVLHIVVGADKMLPENKIGKNIELDIPADLARGFVYYYTIKAKLGHIDAKEPFFVKALAVDGFYNTYLYREMCHAMNVK